MMLTPLCISSNLAASFSIRGFSEVLPEIAISPVSPGITVYAAAPSWVETYPSALIICCASSLCRKVRNAVFTSLDTLLSW